MYMLLFFSFECIDKLADKDNLNATYLYFQFFFYIKYFAFNRFIAMLIVFITVYLQNAQKDILEGTVPIYVFHQCMVIDADKGATVHHVIISTGVMSHWKMQVIKIDDTNIPVFYRTKNTKFEKLLFHEFSQICNTFCISVHSSCSKMTIKALFL